MCHARAAAVPDCFDRNGEPWIIATKDGNAADLTVGRLAGLEAYLYDELRRHHVSLPTLSNSANPGSDDHQSRPIARRGRALRPRGVRVGVRHEVISPALTTIS